MRAFVVRPFGEKEGIDFDRVERELIQPAIARVQQLGIDLKGGTTGEITRQGNVREDMFRLLVIAELVIADVSIHNANAFYELGIRHALRPGSTFLIRSETEHKYPFDLQTDRYFLYDAKDPGARVEALAQALRSTLNAAQRRDSPIFQLLPNLQPHGRQQLVKVPGDFADDVELAGKTDQRGKLRLFAQEARSFEWDQEGLRLIGDAQFKLRAFYGARETFDALLQAAPDDVKANQRLGTIYQRLTLFEPAERKEDLLTRSDQAIKHALEAAKTAADRAEACSLLASNEKSRWIDELRAAAPADEARATVLPARQATVLRSAHFARMLELYLKAANIDLNAHYPAVNALGMLSAQALVGRTLTDAWQSGFDDDEKAEAGLKARETLASRLTSSLSLALEMDEVMGKRDGPPDSWAASSRADLLLFSAPNKPNRIAQAYRLAIAGADRFTLEATRRNLALFLDLGLFEPGLTTALEVDARRATLVALYNPDLDPDGPGGTAHLVNEARRWGFKSVELDARSLLAE